ncbi:hypothetical protein ACFLYZ_01730, partial [Thermodesulfobacteriota bacterium]
DGIAKAFSEPIEMIREKILTSIEQKNGIQIERSSMVRVDKCLRDLLTSTPHLAKISTGNTIIRVKIELVAGTSQKSVWTQWKTRKLESPKYLRLPYIIFNVINLNTFLKNCLAIPFSTVSVEIAQG